MTEKDYKVGDIDSKGRTFVCQLKDGRKIWQKSEDDITTEFALTSTVFKRGGNEVDVAATSQRMMFGLFEIDDFPLVLNNLEGKPSENPEAIGAKAFMLLSRLSGQFAQGAPDPKL